MAKAYNAECPVCLSAEGKFVVTACCHKIHEDCAALLPSLSCPICRERAPGFPPEVERRIGKKEGEPPSPEAAALVLAASVLSEHLPLRYVPVGVSSPDWLGLGDILASIFLVVGGRIEEDLEGEEAVSDEEPSDPFEEENLMILAMDGGVP